MKKYILSPGDKIPGTVLLMTCRAEDGTCVLSDSYAGVDFIISPNREIKYTQHKQDWFAQNRGTIDLISVEIIDMVLELKEEKK